MSFNLWLLLFRDVDRKDRFVLTACFVKSLSKVKYNDKYCVFIPVDDFAGYLSTFY